MKYLKIAFGLLAISVISQTGLQAQNLYSSASHPIIVETATELVANSNKVDATAVSEIAQFIQDQVEFPFEELQFSNEVKFVVEVEIDKAGKIINRRIVDSSNSNFEKGVLRKLTNLKQVSPITKGGLPIKQIVHIPVTYTL